MGGTPCRGSFRKSVFEKSLYYELVNIYKYAKSTSLATVKSITTLCQVYLTSLTNLPHWHQAQSSPPQLFAKSTLPHRQIYLNGLCQVNHNSLPSLPNLTAKSTSLATVKSTTTLCQVYLTSPTNIPHWSQSSQPQLFGKSILPHCQIYLTGLCQFNHNVLASLSYLTDKSTSPQSSLPHLSQVYLTSVKSNHNSSSLPYFCITAKSASPQSSQPHTFFNSTVPHCQVYLTQVSQVNHNFLSSLPYLTAKSILHQSSHCQVSIYIIYEG